jgi:hypothetical protein
VPKYPTKADYGLNTAAFKTCHCGGRLKVLDCRASKAQGMTFIRRRYGCVACPDRVTTGEFVIYQGPRDPAAKHGSDFLLSKHAIAKNAAAKAIKTGSSLRR